MSRPDPRLRLAPESLPPAASRDFFLRPTRTVARQALGGWFVRRWRGNYYGARLVEVEAYLGARDRAAHTWNGRRTARTEPMYAAGGHLYVYFVYGLHHCGNLVTRPADTGEAVLIRAAEIADDPAARLLSGPAKFCAALGISRIHSGLDLTEDGEFSFHPAPVPAHAIARSARIGVAYAGEAALWPLRYTLKKSVAISV